MAILSLSLIHISMGKIIDRYPPERRYILAIMQDLQKQFNYLPKEALQMTAEHVNAPMTVIFSMATFYKADVYKRQPLMCLQCDTAACEKVCPSGALKRNEATGALVVDDAKCIRCKMCVQACPFGNIAYDPAKSRILRCDLCDGERCV